jgi:hypothetical protein
VWSWLFPTPSWGGNPSPEGGVRGLDPATKPA